MHIALNIQGVNGSEGPTSRTPYFNLVCIQPLLGCSYKRYFWPGRAYVLMSCQYRHCNSGAQLPVRFKNDVVFSPSAEYWSRFSGWSLASLLRSWIIFVSYILFINIRYLDPVSDLTQEQSAEILKSGIKSQRDIHHSAFSISQDGTLIWWC